MLLESLEERNLLATTTGNPIEQARAYLSSNADALGLDSPDLSDLTHVFTHVSSFGSVERFEQRVQGLPVYGAEIAVTMLNNGEASYVYNSYQRGLQLASTMPTVAPTQARAAAIAEFGLTGTFRHDDTHMIVFSDKGGAHLAYQVELSPMEGVIGSFEVVVDARTGDILQARDQAQYVNGTGMVFEPDPLTSNTAVYGSGGYTDANDADSPALTAARKSVTLQSITQTGSTYSLVGPYAQIVDVEAPMNGLFTQSSSAFNFTRNQDGFEAVNAYYHLDRWLRYLNVTLGLTVMPIQYAGGVKFDPSGEMGADNSHFDPTTGELVFGEGGVDDAEDADVLIHELGHGIHDWVTGGNASSFEGLGEGTGDYFAQAYSRAYGLWPSSNPAYQYVFSWDGHNEYWPGRVTDYTFTYPNGLTGDDHEDGQIWATANMKIYDQLGATKTNTMMVEGLAMTGSSTSQEEAAQALLQAAFNLGYPQADIHSAFVVYQATGYSVTEPMPPTELRGTVFDDANANGARDTGETGQALWTVFLDLNNNGVRDGGAASFASSDVPKPIPDPGIATSQTVVSGFASTIIDLNVTLSLTHTWDSDLVITLISPNNTRIRLANRVGGSGDNFSGTVFDDQATNSISGGTAPFSGSFKPSSSLSALNGTNPNGTWKLEVTDVALLDVGTISSWSLAINTGEPATTTNANGDYVLANLTAGTYNVREVVQPTWTQTTPVVGFHAVTLAAGQTITGLDFGNTQAVLPPPSPPTISDVADVTLPEDTSITSDITIGDAQTPAAFLAMSAATSNPTLLPLSGIFFSGTGANRTVKFTPAANEFGTVTVTLTVKDLSGLSAQDTVLVTVTPVNDRPTITRGADSTVLNIAGLQTLTNWATGISPGPANESAQTLQVNITNNSNPALFSSGPTIAANGTLTFAPANGALGTATITFVARDNGGTANGGVDTSLPQTFTITFTAPPTYQVLGYTPTNTGAAIDFGRELMVSPLNLYDVSPSVFGAADLTLVGATVGNVRGSLVVDPSLRKVTFVKTSGALEPDTYTLTLRSGADAFQDFSGGLLDGDANDTAGGNYVRTFVVSPPASNAITLSIGNFARGPGQPVNLPASATTGIPISLSNGGGISSVGFRLHYNPALLNITGATIAPGIPFSTVTVNTTATPGIAIVQFNSIVPMPEGTTRFIDLQASVPSSAPYLSKHVLDITSVSLNVGAVPSLDDDAVAVVAYVGDTNANGTYGSSDVSRSLRLAAALDSGLQNYRLLDPRIVADITGNGSISGTDATRLQQAVVGIPTGDIPTPLPSVTLTTGGPDPKLSIPADLAAAPGQSLTVPVNIDSIVDLTGNGLDGAELVIHYDPTALDITEVTLGSLVQGSGWQLSSRIDPLAGRVLISAAALTPLEGVFAGELVELHGRVKADAPSGAIPINLAASARDLAIRTQLNEGWLTLIPAPTDAPNDPGVDGLVTIVAAADSPTPRQSRAAYLANLLQLTGAVGPQSSSSSFQTTHANFAATSDAALLQLLAEWGGAGGDSIISPLIRLRRR